MISSVGKQALTILFFHLKMHNCFHSGDKTRHHWGRSWIDFPTSTPPKSLRFRNNAKPFEKEKN